VLQIVSCGIGAGAFGFQAMAAIDFSTFKRDDGNVDEVVSWTVVLLLTSDQSQHTRIEKTFDVKKMMRTLSQTTEGRCWKIGVICPVESEIQADSFIMNLTTETKTRGSSSRSVVFESVARELGLIVYNDLGAIFKNPDAENLILRVSTSNLPRNKERKGKRKVN
jgi:hypothetical protein